MVSNPLANLPKTTFYSTILKLGEVSERLMVPLSKSGPRLYRGVGSNPTLSAS